MRFAAMVLVMSLVLILAAGAAPLDGRKIKLSAGGNKSECVPLSLPCTETAEGVTTVVETKTAKAFPATLRDGQLTFVAEGAMPGTEHTYEVSVEDAFEGHFPKVRIEKQDGKDIVDVYIEDKHFTSYHYSNDYKKPFLYPVNSEGGVGVTRGYPMDTSVDTPKMAQDHPHHKSLYTAYGEVNGVDCWAEGGGSGFQHSGEVTFGSGDAYGWIQAKNVWQDKDHKPVVTEEREYRFYASPEDARLLDVFVTFKADYGDANFTDTKEGGLVAVRMRPELSYRHAEITNIHGDKGEKNCWGKPSPWCDYSGEMEDIGYRGLAVFDHPSNMRHPNSWHVRGYGLMGANCFGYSYFSEKEHNKGLIPENGDFLLKSGEQFNMQYRVYIHSGDVEKAKVNERYNDFATPPTVAWAE